MRGRRGFTVVELVVVMVIMAILLALAMVNVSSNMADARDAQRKAKAEAIARGLEARYRNGNPIITAHPSEFDPSIKAGSYPGLDEGLHILGWDRTGFTPLQVTGGYFTKAFPGTTPSDFIFPGGDPWKDLGLLNFFCANAPYGADVAANEAAIKANCVDTTKAFYLAIDEYNAVCSGTVTCNRYKLFYKTEKDNVVHTIESKHQ